MQNLENAIRQTFTKINIHDSQMRQRVYHSVWQVYEQALRKHSQDPALLLRQKQSYDALIDKIEKEFTPAPETVSTEPTAPASSFSELNISASSGFGNVLPKGQEPSFSADEDSEPLHLSRPAPSFRFDGGANSLKEEPSLPSLSALAGSSSFRQNDIHATDTPKRVSFKHLFWGGLWAFWLIVGGASLFSLYKDSFGLAVHPLEQGSNSAPVTLAQEMGSEDPLSTSGQPGVDWVKLFSAKDNKRLKFQGDIIAKLENDKDESYLHIVAKRDSDKILVPISLEILQKFHGQKVNFVLVTRAGAVADAKKQQTSHKIRINCDFGNGKRSGIYHYDLAVDRNELVMPTSLPSHASPNSYLVIRGDEAKKNYSIDIYSIFVFAEEPNK